MTSVLLHEPTGRNFFSPALVVHSTTISASPETMTYSRSPYAPDEELSPSSSWYSLDRSESVFRERHCFRTKKPAFPCGPIIQFDHSTEMIRAILWWHSP